MQADPVVELNKWFRKCTVGHAVAFVLRDPLREGSFGIGSRLSLLLDVACG